MKSESKKRRWVDKHRNNLPALHKEIQKRIAVLKNMLWTSDPLPFAWWVSGILGVIPADIAFNRALKACLRLKTEEDSTVNFYNLLAADCAVMYFNRVEKGHCKIFLYERPCKIPAGYIHLFDLTPKELFERLSVALRAQGIEREKAFLINREIKPPQPSDQSAITPPDSLIHQAEALKQAFLAEVEQKLEKEGVKGPALDKIKQKIVDEYFTTEGTKAILEGTARFSESYKKKLLQGHKYYTEQLKSLAAAQSRPGNAAGKSQLEDKLKAIKGIVCDFGRVPLVPISGYETPVDPTLGIPEKLYRLQQEIYDRRKDVQEIYSKCDSRNAALSECQTKYPGLTQQQIAEYRASARHNTSKALQEAATEMQFKGLDYATKLCSRGKDNARVNMIWAAYLDKYFPGTEAVTPDNFPDTPPVTLPKS